MVHTGTLIWKGTLKLVISKYTHDVTMFLSEISYRKCIHLLQEVGVQFSFEFGLNSFRVDFSAGFKACILQPGAQPNFLSYTAEG